MDKQIALEQAAQIIASLWPDTLEQRLRDFLQESYGPAWQYCEMEARTLPDGHLVFLAALSDIGGGVASGISGELPLRIEMIAPVEDGSFLFCPPSQIQDASLVDIEKEEDIIVSPQCLALLSLALKQASVLVNQSTHANLQQRAWICEQLAHMNRHLKTQEGE